MQFVTQLDPKAEGAKGTGFFFHGSYYAEQVLRGATSDAAKRWREGIRDQLLCSDLRRLWRPDEPNADRNGSPIST